MAPLEERLKELEKKVDALENIVHQAIGNLKCPECGFLMSVHEEYEAVYHFTSHAQCYRCGFVQEVEEPSWKRRPIRRLAFSPKSRQAKSG